MNKTGYIIEDSAIYERFARGILHDKITPDKIRSIEIYEGVSPSELLNNLRATKEYALLGYIQRKEAVLFSKKTSTIAISSHSGNARKNHLLGLIKRFMQTNGITYAVNIKKKRKTSMQMAKEWYSRLPKPVPERIIFGSVQGIGTILYGYDFPKQTKPHKSHLSDFNDYYKNRLSRYSSKTYIKTNFGRFNEKLSKDFVNTLKEDPLFSADSKILWSIKNKTKTFEKGFSKQLEYVKDDYLDYAYMKIRGNTFLVTHYPYGDQLNTVLKILKKKLKLKSVYFLGSCGSLVRNHRLNNLVIPTSLTYKNKRIDFHNTFAELIGNKFKYGPLNISCHKGKVIIVDSPLTETYEQLNGFVKKGFDCIEVEAYHLLSAAANIPEVGVIYYISDMPLHGSNLAHSPPSYIGWKTAAINMINLL